MINIKAVSSTSSTSPKWEKKTYYEGGA